MPARHPRDSGMVVNQGKTVPEDEVKVEWWPQQESNLHLPLRRGLFYPLNHGAEPVVIVPQVKTLACPSCSSFNNTPDT